MNTARSIPGPVVALLCLAIAAGCAASRDASSAAGGYAAREQLENDPNRMVCKRQKETGSRLSSRVCRTAAEWEQQRLDNEEAIRNATRSGVRPDDRPSAGGG